MFLVDGFDGALEAAEEVFGADEGRLQIDGVGELVDCCAMLVASCIVAEKIYVLYLRTSSKCLRCCMMTSRCFSRMARAMKRWKPLLSQSVQRVSQSRNTSTHSNSRLYQTRSMRKKKKKLVESADWRWRYSFGSMSCTRWSSVRSCVRMPD